MNQLPHSWEFLGRKMGLSCSMLFGKRLRFGREKQKAVCGKRMTPPAQRRHAGGVVADFLRSQLRRIGLGHPLGRDPSRTSMPASRTSPANSNGHQPARSNLVDRLLRWPFVRYASNTVTAGAIIPKVPVENSQPSRGGVYPHRLHPEEVRRGATGERRARYRGDEAHGTEPVGDQ